MQNRIIKFRAWCPTIEVMFDEVCPGNDGMMGMDFDSFKSIVEESVNLILDDDDAIIISRVYTTPENDDWVDEIKMEYPAGEDWIWVEKKYLEWMQYTGLKDKNGVEIYEGDILSGHSDGNVKVAWSDTNAGWECFFDDEANIGLSELCAWFGNNAIVIGNIFQNPELLQK